MLVLYQVSFLRYVCGLPSLFQYLFFSGCQYEAIQLPVNCRVARDHTQVYDTTWEAEPRGLPLGDATLKFFFLLNNLAN